MIDHRRSLQKMFALCLSYSLVLYSLYDLFQHTSFRSSTKIIERRLLEEASTHFSAAPPIWLNEMGDEVAEEITISTEGIPVLYCPFIQARKIKEYNPVSGCALVASMVPRYVRKNGFTSTMVMCAMNATSGVQIDETILTRLGLVVHGRSLISYLYPGPATSLTFYENNIEINSAQRIMNIKSLIFKSNSSISPTNCSDIQI